MKILKDLKT